MNKKDIIIPPKSEFIDIISSVFEKNGLNSLIDTDKTGIFADLGIHMIDENAKYNLTSILKPEDIALLHFADSLIFSDEYQVDAKVLDIGAGAGFPSLPLAIARPDLTIISLDSTQKKCDYIENTAKLLGLHNISAICGRAEEIFAAGMSPSLRGTFDIVTARAVAGLPVLCELGCGALKHEGFLIALKGPDASSELPDNLSILSKTGLSFEKAIEKSLSGSQSYGRTCVVFKKSGKTDLRYPRRYSEIKKKPLF